MAKLLWDQKPVNFIPFQLPRPIYMLEKKKKKKKNASVPLFIGNVH